MIMMLDVESSNRQYKTIMIKLTYQNNRQSCSLASSVHCRSCIQRGWWLVRCLGLDLYEQPMRKKCNMQSLYPLAGLPLCDTVGQPDHHKKYNTVITQATVFVRLSLRINTDDGKKVGGPPTFLPSLVTQEIKKKNKDSTINLV
jgi:hypothetical protein